LIQGDTIQPNIDKLHCGRISCYWKNANIIQFWYS